MPIYLPTCQYQYVYYVHVVLLITYHIHATIATLHVHIYYNITYPFFITESSTVEVVSSIDEPKENTVWPFQSVKEKMLDEEANLPPPHIDEVTGIYCLVSTSFVDSEKLNVNCKIIYTFLTYLLYNYCHLLIL